MKRCRKCGSSKEPVGRQYRTQFVSGACTSGVCPDSEHLHLTCECGFEGIAPTEGHDLGVPHVQTQTPSIAERVKHRFGFG